jgi:quinol monooxygenase YgiN
MVLTFPHQAVTSTQPKGVPVSIHVFVRFDAKPAELGRLRKELLTIVPATRNEPGNLDIHLFEQKNNSGTFFIHSLWKDDAAIEAHFQYPHMKHFLGVLDSLVTNEVKAIRTDQLA